jgi:predicted transcriptional regulator
MKGRGLRTLGFLLIACLVATGFAAAKVQSNGGGSSRTLAASGCQLASVGDNIKHVIYIQFDNTHFLRDNGNVPSDLEQMPHLLNFIRGNGTLMTNDHTALISHTATGILTSLTGVYPDRMGQPVSNSFRYFTPSGATRTGVSFAYWTAPLFDPAGPPFPPTGQTDLTPEMINENGKIAPAPWVPYTRAGCDVGQVATANTVLENTGIDVPTVFGAGSPEAIQAAADSPGTPATQTFADYIGIGVHCAQDSSVCAAANHGRPDLLPDEPNGYTGYNGLFGAKYVDPIIKPSGPMTDLDGNTIQDQNHHIGFPGFDGMTATVSLSWIAQMQEAGVPITYGYISDAHDGHGTSGNIHFAYGPGEAGYVQQLKDYDSAFGKFFNRLADDGINKSNTLFVFTVDEGDHFVGDQPTPAGCNGIAVPCTYNRVGEINGNLSAMIRTQFADNTAFTVHSDDAPNVYITGNPSQTDPATRKLEREMAQLSWLNPYTNQTENNIMVALADKTEMKTLHMITADPARTPTFTPFADPDWFFFASNSPATCATQVACAFIPGRTNQSFAWNHGDIQDEIASTWVGVVGPGVKNGSDYTGWTDHTDVRPTMLSLLGLRDDYIRDGRTVTQVLDPGAVPATLQTSDAVALGDMLKRIDAPFGQFAMDTLKASTVALASDTNHDNRYTTLEKSIAQVTDQRDQLVDQIKALLAGAEAGQAIDHDTAAQILDRAQGLLGRAGGLAGH